MSTKIWTKTDEALKVFELENERCIRMGDYRPTRASVAAMLRVIVTAIKEGAESQETK